MNYTTTDDSSSSSSSDDKNEGKNYFNKSFTSKYKRDPYNILNQSRNASTVEIQRAYKRGSRALHPDKQQAKAVGVQQRNQGHTDEMDTIFLSDDDVQEAFIVLKEACKFSERKRGGEIKVFTNVVIFPFSFSDPYYPT